MFDGLQSHPQHKIVHEHYIFLHSLLHKSTPFCPTVHTREFSSAKQNSTTTNQSALHQQSNLWLVPSDPTTLLSFDLNTQI